MGEDTPSEATLGSFISRNAQTFDQARRQLPLLPKASTQVQALTFSEAFNAVQNRDEEKRRAVAKRDKHKPRSSKSKEYVADTQYPAAIPGAETNNTAFWISTEGYFRDVTTKDMELLCPQHDEPLKDPIFAVPFPGPADEPEEEKVAAKPKQQRVLSHLKRKQEGDIQPSPAVPGLATANGSQVGESEKQRKSRRLGAKAAIREAETKKLSELSTPVSTPAPTPAPQTLPEVKLQPEPEAPAPAVADVLKPPEPLMTAAREQDVATLTSQVIELMGVDNETVAAAAGLEASQLDSWIEAGTSGGGMKEASLEPQVLAEMHKWLASQGEAMTSGALGGNDRSDSNSQVSKWLNGKAAAEDLPPSWGAWLKLMRTADLSKDLTHPPLLQSLMPYTELMLQQPPTVYVEQPEAMGPSRDGGAATPSALTPATSGDHSKLTKEAVADTASGEFSLGGRGAVIPGPASPFTPNYMLAAPGKAAPSGLAMTQQATPGSSAGLALLVTPSTPANGPFALTPNPVELAERLQSHSEAGPSNTGLAGGKSRGHVGKKKAQSLAATLLGKNKQKGFSTVDPLRNAITSAVASHIAAGPSEGDPEAQWRQLSEASDLLTMAPDDEILAEMLALHSELLQQMAVNQGRAANLLRAVLQDLPRQLEAAALREQGIEVAKAAIAKQRTAKRIAKREKREVAQREAQKAAEATLQISPRKVPGRMRSSAHEGSGPPSTGTTPPPEASMVDLLADRGAEDDALCAICGGGDSSKVDANEIVFCERCDVAVHQKCYGVDVIPSGEWLCWPCKRFEEGELASGKPQSQIRAPRWEQGAPAKPGGSPNKDLQGGGRSVACLLCPVRRGAFRQTTDCKHWVHQVCAMWHPETTVLQTTACAAIEGYNDIKLDRWGAECFACRRTDGAIIRCNAGHCAQAFHPLCARNNGQHLATREAPGGGPPLRRAYCTLHSDSQREKDLGHATAAEGPGNFMRKEARIRQHLHRATAAAMGAYTARFEERKVLTRARLELESLRILLQRINKREKLKREEVRASFELHRGRMTRPDWVPHIPVAPPPPEQDPTEGLGRGKRARTRLEPVTRSPSVQVDREVMMTTGEAAATNDKLPKGFMYVPFDSLKGGSGQPP